MERAANAPALRRLGALFAITAAVAVTGCGGSSGTTPSPPPGSTPSPSSPPPAAAPAANAVTASSSGAQALVKTVNDNVATVVAADAASNAPGAIGSLFADLPTGATQSGTFDCNLYGSSGSGSITYTVTTSDSTFQPLSGSYTYNNCRFGEGDTTYSFNGSGSYSYNYAGSTLTSFTVRYNLTYAITGPYSDSGTINSSSTCTYGSSGLSCAYNIGDASVTSATVSRSGSVTTVSSGTVRTRGSATSNNLTINYSGWRYDASTGRATSGTVTVTDSSGNTATLTVTATGYRVVVNVAGTTSTYDVAF